METQQIAIKHKKNKIEIVELKNTVTEIFNTIKERVNKPEQKSEEHFKTKAQKDKIMPKYKRAQETYMSCESQKLIWEQTDQKQS